MRRTILLLLLTILYAGSIFGQAAQFFPSDRFSSSLVSDLCQDQMGSVWVATDYGLNKFDGYRFAYYLPDDKDPSSINVNVVVTLFCDKDGRLWVD